MNGSFSKASRFSAGSTTYGYKSDLAGVTIGSDYAFGAGYAAGVSVSFGTGSEVKKTVQASRMKLITTESISTASGPTNTSI